jgi:hypothetical protein
MLCEKSAMIFDANVFSYCLFQMAFGFSISNDIAWCMPDSGSFHNLLTYSRLCETSDVQAPCRYNANRIGIAEDSWQVKEAERYCPCRIRINANCIDEICGTHY